MKEHPTYEQIVEKVQQHEQTITQLVKIIASMNQQINELNNKQKSYDSFSL
ncbi:hypothetical protein ACLIBH_07180 [Virgibacillus sp. W0430]|uniref:hypothetical protein n=1 Tax=Virgibacillus sp. W0430 TaxID=3391580 RepID=UPI003F48612D